METAEELDLQEKSIVKLAIEATKEAYLAALKRGSSVMEIVDDHIVSTAPNGTRTRIKKATPKILVKDLLETQAKKQRFLITTNP